MRLITKNIANTNFTVKQGNAEEQPGAGCGIKRWEAAARAAVFLSSFTGYPRRINLRGLGTESPLLFKLQICPQNILQTARMPVPSPAPASSIFLIFPLHSYKLLYGWNRLSEISPWIS